MGNASVPVLTALGTRFAAMLNGVVVVGNIDRFKNFACRFQRRTGDVSGGRRAGQPENRSATAGVGTFTAEFDHMAEVTGRLADDVLAQAGRKAA